MMKQQYTTSAEIRFKIEPSLCVAQTRPTLPGLGMARSPMRLRMSSLFCLRYKCEHAFAYVCAYAYVVCVNQP